MTAFTNLSLLWAERDNRYSLRKVMGQTAPLTPEEMNAIRTYRRSEAIDLPDSDRDLALMELSRWNPPVMSIR